MSQSDKTLHELVDDVECCRAQHDHTAEAGALRKLSAAADYQADTADMRADEQRQQS